MNIAIIGAGLIGKKRAEALPKKVKLSFVCDVSQERAEALATEFKCESATDWKEVVARHAFFFFGLLIDWSRG
jgi:predicted dehydrogenase